MNDEVGRQDFILPLSNIKRESSILDKKIVFSHYPDENGELKPGSLDIEIDRQLHNGNVKIKFFIIGFIYEETGAHINYIGKWVELEKYQSDYLPPTIAIPDTYFLGFYPYVRDNKLMIRLKLTSFPMKDLLCEIYIEKISIIDSDFDSEKSYIIDPNIQEIFPRPEIPDPVFPYVDNYANASNSWLF